MTVTLDTIPAEIPRDRFSRPIVKRPDGKGTTPYTRCTTFVSVLEDTWMLSNWSQRNVAIGLSLRPDLLLSVSAHRDDKTKLQKLCDDAKEAAADRAGATTGTALHTLTEKVDRGIDPGPIPEQNLADIIAYAQATENLVAEHIEPFCVLDSLKIGGTPDRVVRWTGHHPLLTTGKRYISDLKTASSLDFGVAKMASQLAVYARSQLYDIATGARSDHGAEFDKGLIVHLPAGTGVCTVYVIDLLRGWEGVKLAKQVREWRSGDKKDAFLVDLSAPVLAGPSGLQPGHPWRSAPEVTAPDPILAAIAVATREELNALWRRNRAAWTDVHTAAAQTRLGALQDTA